MPFLNITGATKICGIIGDPIEHSFSPFMHNAAFAALGLDYAYVPFHVKRDNLSDALKAVRALNIKGINVTVPHKQAVLQYLDEISSSASLIGAVNTVVNNHGYLVGYNTDAPGFVRSLKEQAGFSPEGAGIFILGAGGAARAVAVELALSGASLIHIANRTVDRAEEIAGLIEGNTSCSSKAYSQQDLSLSKLMKDADLIIQTTSQGMYPRVTELPAYPLDAFHAGQLVCDLIYNPRQTIFLQMAEQCGAKTLNGMGMLLYQGALAFEYWTGLASPVEIMDQALRQVI
ncbi:shikimate 5-dehydrogenase [Desulfofarcimen acetoxidans DSM 771]|jgi:shikimate dehydrogenase|uniref:Shikimate dehydrogenase (NADP(+)) n=1 Tax=Desulfofarcimen acetoxidans (strain ATCC 49208 / DSM 771 / KCTC 5769 / VKM B-1644 / 5575) TaxID=485916 RepID=C8W1Q3_DESAS|nr:shikimate dehydrogenase [Desulfofarcimen acetoxidans]ACV63524.1 shikimate 5-dehydrogenase [Desulfofarcimen acetoxidans DSM 771]